MCRTKNLTGKEREEIKRLDRSFIGCDGTAAKPNALGKSISSIIGIPENLLKDNSIFKNHLLIAIPKDKIPKTDYEGCLHDIGRFKAMAEKFADGLDSANILTSEEVKELKEYMQNYVEDYLLDRAEVLKEDEPEYTQEDYETERAEAIIDDPDAHYISGVGVFYD